tara:strand:- start:609 stop:1868 length:1260 start_codon:yes stop_codon:yes gene_type:complete
MTDRLKNIFHTLIIFITVISLLYSNILPNFVWTFPDLFLDFKMPLNWLECHSLGFDLITIESIDCGTGKKISQFNYGYIFLSIPYNDILSVFYREYLPWILIFFFIYLTLKIINPKNKLDIILVYLALLNPSTMLLIERMQLDCLFYIAIIFTIYNRFYFINWFLGFYFTLIKFYPIAFLITIFIEDKNRSIKKIFIIIISLIIIFSIYLYINREFYSFMLNNMLPGKAGYHFLYSLNAIPKIFKYVFGIKYQVLLLIFYSLFIFTTFKIYKKINLQNVLWQKKGNHYLNKVMYTNDSKIFLIGGYFSVFLFILVSSYAYKEIFLILLIPLILNIKNNYSDKIFTVLIYIFIFRYCYLFLYAYFNIHDGITFLDGQRIFSTKFLLAIFFKAILDFVLISVISAILYLKTKIYILDKFRN